MKGRSYALLRAVILAAAGAVGAASLVQAIKVIAPQLTESELARAAIFLFVAIVCSGVSASFVISDLIRSDR